MGPIVLGHTRAVSYYNPSVVDSIHPDIHRLSAYLLVDRRTWGSAEREDFKNTKTLEKLKDNKDPSGRALGRQSKDKEKHRVKKYIFGKEQSQQR